MVKNALTQTFFLFLLKLNLLSKNEFMNKIKALFVLVFLILTLRTFCQQSRTLKEVNDGWEFRSKDISGDSVNTIVTLPHTWNARDALLGFDYYRGKGEYSKIITIDKTFKGKRVFLKFMGVQSVADVYFNEIHLGQHRGGYSAFVFEATPYIRFDSANKIRVVADNSRYDDILPLGGDFNIYGGIYRPVQLLITNEACITPLDFGSSGVYLKQKEVSSEEAKIEAEIVISNGNSDEKKILVSTTVFDNKGLKVALYQQVDTFPPGITKIINQPLSILKPHLWNGRNDPYMYNCKVQILINGVITDEINQPLGLRFFEVTADNGFFLNGKSLKLHGVSRHQDKEEVASALSASDHKTDIKLILEMGANAIRLSHYQHDDYFYSLCDSSGLVVWSEIPFVGSLMGGYTNSDAFHENAKQQLIELIRQNYNHPSICFWGIFNELSNPGKNSPFEIVTALNELARKEDPFRLTTAATFLSDKDKLNFITSVVAWNKYFGWYYGNPGMLGKWADKLHSQYPDLKIGISEYGAGGNPDQHAENIKRPFPFFHYLNPEAYEAEYHEKSWEEIVKRPYIWGSFIWNMFDFGVSFRDEGGMTARNNKGMVTFDRKIKKDVFYFYKANWNPDPMIYITNRRFIHRNSRVTDVKVYSNAEKVELFANGFSLGIKTGSNSTFQWKNVHLQEGNNSIKAVTEIGGFRYEDKCIWDYKKHAAINAFIWFLRIGIKPFIGLCLIAIVFLYIKIVRQLKKNWKRKLSMIALWFLIILMVAFLILFIYGKMNYVNIFDYSVI